MALSANRNLVDQEGKLLAMPVAASHIYKGALVKINAAGYIAPCSGEAGSQFAGVAIEECDNSAGDAGDEVVRIAQEGCVELPIVGASQADVGSQVYASDDSSVTTTEGTSSLQKVGVIVKYVSSTKVLVKLMPYSGVGASA
jgi:predicted RecA/RadA family phage recombinase